MALEAQDNPFPSVLFRETVDPANPSAGDQRLFVDTDHLLKLRDSAGTVTTFGASGIPATIIDAKGDLIAGSAADTAAKLTAGANDTILMADSGQSTGLKWVASQTPSTQAFSDAAAEGTADTYARGDHKHAMPANPGGGGALVFLEAHTASASATLDFTTFISSTYDDYLFEGVGLKPATTSQALWMRAGTGGGPTYDTGTNYHGAQVGYTSGSATSNVAHSAATASTICNLVVNDAGYGIANFSLRLMDPQNATNHKHIHGTTTFHNGTAQVGASFGSLYASATALTAVRFMFASGNITSGTIRVYGIAKS